MMSHDPRGIIIIGMLLQIVIGGLAIAIASSMVHTWMSIVLVGTVLILTNVLALLPLAFLSFEKTKTIGYVMSIIMGIVFISYGFGLPLGIALVAAGIIGFFNKK